MKSSWKIIIFTTFVFHSCIFTVIFNFLIKVIMHTGLVMMGHPVYHHDCLHYSWVSTTIVGHIVSSFKDPCIHNFQPREPWIPTNFRFWQFCLCDAATSWSLIIKRRTFWFSLCSWPKSHSTHCRWSFLLLKVDLRSEPLPIWPSCSPSLNCLIVWLRKYW